MVHQHFMLVPVFTVAETSPWASSAPARSACSTGGGPAGTCVSCPSSTGCGSTRTRWSKTCPVGVQQRVEIVKALLREANVLILDEPTSVLTR